MILVANARMYAPAAGAAAAWRLFLQDLSRRAGVPLQVVDHAFPASLADLWARPDLACAFMCGWPLARERRRKVTRPVLAAPVPKAGWAAGRPVYRTHLVTARGGPATLEATCGGRLGFTAFDSHSGWNMPRRHLLRAGARYRELVGPLVTPRRAAEAVRDGLADVAPLDAYAQALLARHAPELADALQTVAATDQAPIPPLVAAPKTPSDIADRLRAALLASATDATDLLEPLCLLGFAEVTAADYDVTLGWERGDAKDLLRPVDAGSGGV